MKDYVREYGILIKLSNKETDEYFKLREELFNKGIIGPKSQSELFYQAFKEYAQKLIASYSTNTQTNQQCYNNIELKNQKLNEIKGFIRKSPKTFTQIFNYFFHSFKEIYGTPRTCLSWLKMLFEADEFVILNLKSKFSDYYVIEKNSYWHAQLKKHCLKFPHHKINYQPTSIQAAKTKLYNYLSVDLAAKEFNSLDKAEEFSCVMLKQYLVGEEKPIINDPIISSVLQLRAEWKHTEADKELDYVKEVRAMRIAQSQRAAAEKEAEEVLGGLF